MPALLIAVLILLAAPSAAAAAPAPVKLDTGWEFRFDSNPRFAPVSVPHVFDPKPADTDFQGKVGWYRLRFDGPASPPGYTWNVDFEGVRRVSRVWLNGRPIGVNSNPYQTFSLPARGLKPGQPNELLVRVHNLRPKDLREGWWNWGGIVRPVSLRPRGEIAYEDVGVLSDVKCPRVQCEAIARTDGWVVNRTRAVQSPQIAFRMTADTGFTFTKTVTVHRLKPGERRRVGFPMKVQGLPLLWSPAAPNLYTATV